MRSEALNQNEMQLQTRLWERTLPFIRHMFLAASCLFLVFLAWDSRVAAPGSADTVFERLVAAGYFALMYVLVSFTRAGRRYLKLIYVASVLVVSALLLWIFLQIEGAYVLGHGTFLAVIMVVIVIGPTQRIAIPLALVALVIPNALVLLMPHAGIHAPGLPGADTAIDLALVHAGVGVIAAILIVVHNRLQRQTLMDNMHYEQLAGTDPLTAVHNRRQLETEFNRERVRQRRSGRPIGVLELDIDHFKRVNDVHGHGVGDEVLRNLTRRWRGLVREIDILARVGGEEFIVLLPETDAAGALDSAERLRVNTAFEPLSTSAGGLEVTVSIGITLARPDGDGLDEVLKRVDRALYRAKDNGRNRCELDETGPAPAAHSGPGRAG